MLHWHVNTYCASIIAVSGRFSSIFIILVKFGHPTWAAPLATKTVEFFIKRFGPDFTVTPGTIYP